MKKLLSLSILVLLLSCNNKADFTKIKPGMKLEEVVSLVGEPKEKQDNPLLGKWYFYENNLIVFHGDTVAESLTMDEFEKRMTEFNAGLEELTESYKENVSE